MFYVGQKGQYCGPFSSCATNIPSCLTGVTGDTILPMLLLLTYPSVHFGNVLYSLLSGKALVISSLITLFGIFTKSFLKSQVYFTLWLLPTYSLTSSYKLTRKQGRIVRYGSWADHLLADQVYLSPQ